MTRNAEVYWAGVVLLYLFLDPNRRLHRLRWCAGRPAAGYILKDQPPARTPLPPDRGRADFRGPPCRHPAFVSPASVAEEAGGHSHPKSPPTPPPTRMAPENNAAVINFLVVFLHCGALRRDGSQHLCTRRFANTRTRGVVTSRRVASVLNSPPPAMDGAAPQGPPPPYGAWRSALSVIACPVPDMSRPAPAVVWHALSKGIAPRRANMIRAEKNLVYMMVILWCLTM